MPKIIERICQNCGEPYKKQGEKFCSMECRDVFQRAHRHRIKELPKDVLIKLYVNQRLSANEVAKQLGVASMTVTRRLKDHGIYVRNPKEAHRCTAGVNHPSWKGGKHQTPDGYIAIHQPDNPHADVSGYVREHRLVWQQRHDELLPSDWIVHHLNGDRTDNRIENLKAMPRKGHHGHLYIHALQVRIRELEKALEQWSPIALSSIEGIPV